MGASTGLAVGDGPQEPEAPRLEFSLLCEKGEALGDDSAGEVILQAEA